MVQLTGELGHKVYLERCGGWLVASHVCAGQQITSLFANSGFVCVVLTVLPVGPVVCLQSF